MPIIPGLMSYSYHLSFPAGKMTTERFMQRVQELNLKSTEWCHFPCHEPGKVDWAQVKLLHRLGLENGIKNSISGFAPLLSQGERRETMLAMVRTQLEVSTFIGAQRMRFHGMAEMELGIGTPVPLDLCIDNLKRVVELAEKFDIVITLENHLDFRIADFKRIFKEIDSPFLKLNLDTGNSLPLQEDVIQLARTFSEKIVSCHLKGVGFIWRDYGAILTSCQPAASIIDLREILTILSGCPQPVWTHVEVVAMNAEDEDLLVSEHAKFLHEYLNDLDNVPG